MNGHHSYNQNAFCSDLTSEVLQCWKNISGLRSEVQVNRECFALNPSSCWRSSLGTGIQGKTFRYHFALLNAAMVLRINVLINEKSQKKNPLPNGQDKKNAIDQATCKQRLLRLKKMRNCDCTYLRYGIH